MRACSIPSTRAEASPIRPVRPLEDQEEVVRIRAGFFLGDTHKNARPGTSKRSRRTARRP